MPLLAFNVLDEHIIKYLYCIKLSCFGAPYSLMTKSSPELADALMQGKIDVALLRREAHTAGLAFKFLTNAVLQAPASGVAVGT